MKAIGVIAEYNPFHLGHARHLTWIKNQHPEIPVIVAMSGAMTQRGELAYVDKWTRAEAAIRAGADLVVTLPTVHSLSSAEHFGRAGVQLLTRLQVDALSFGVETNKTEELIALASKIDTLSVQTTLKEELKSGAPYGTALRKALIALSPDYEDIVSTPNNSLALSYLRTALQEAPSMNFLPLERNSNHHNEEEQTFPSGSFLRKCLDNGHSILPYLAPSSKDIFSQAIEENRVVDIQRYRDLLLITGRLKSCDELTSFAGFVEGIEQRWKKAFALPNYTETLQYVKTKRFTFSSLQRMTAAMLLGITKEKQMALFAVGPSYAQLLAYSSLGKRYIKENTFSIPLITKWAPFYRQSEGFVKESLDIDRKAQDLQQYCFKNPSYRQGGMDFVRHPIG